MRNVQSGGEGGFLGCRDETNSRVPTILKRFAELCVCEGITPLAKYHKLARRLCLLFWSHTERECIHPDQTFRHFRVPKTPIDELYVVQNRRYRDFKVFGWV